VVSSSQDHRPEVAEVPGQDRCRSLGGHRHYGEVRKVGPGGLVAAGEVDRQGKLRIAGRLESVDPIEQGFAKDDGSMGVSASSQQKVEFGENGPWHQQVAADH
jgi:hypothetical protein